MISKLQSILFLYFRDFEQKTTAKLYTLPTPWFSCPKRPQNLVPPYGYGYKINDALVGE